MRILQVCRQYHPSVGGVERFVAELSARLAERGHDVQVATLNRRWHQRERLPARARVNGLQVHRLAFLGGPLFFVAPAVLRLAAAYDVLHVHNTDFFLDFLAATRALHRRPLVVSTHGGYFHTSEHAALKRLYFALITRRSLRAAAVVVPNSAGDERRFAPWARRARRIDNCIDWAALASLEREAVPGRLLTVGRLAPNKNPGALLEVFARARAIQPGLSLVVVGDGPLRLNLLSLAETLGIAGAVRWTGEIGDEQLWAEMREAECFVSAASYEGFGLALVEAMAAGLIPVVHANEAFREVVEDGRDGFLVDYSNPDEAGRALVRALGLPDEGREQLSNRARAKAAAFDWARAVPRFEEVYEYAVSTQR